MPELSVVIVATDNEQRAVLQVLVDGTNVARVVHTCASFPVTPADPVIRRVRAANPDVTLVDIPADNAPLALRSIELLRQELPDTSIFAIGTLNQPQVIVNAMRAGAREFIERPTNTADLMDAFVRMQASQRKERNEGIRGKVFSVINAKGGNGATTVAVNLALALQSAYGQTALVDMAPLGHAALHMNLKPVFNVADATRNLHRMDESLLKSFMTRSQQWLAIAGGNQRARRCGSFDCGVCEAVRHARKYITVTWWSTCLHGLTLPAVSSPAFRRRFCWLPAATWRRCGARPACTSIWESPGAANASGWC